MAPASSGDRIYPICSRSVATTALAAVDIARFLARS